MKYLVKAAEAGHIGAEYVVSLLQVLMGKEVLKNNGIVAIGRMKATKPKRRALAEFRKNLIDILSNIWILNPIVFLGRQNSNWCSLHHKRSYKNKWRQWPSFDTDDMMRMWIFVVMLVVVMKKLHTLLTFYQLGSRIIYK
ncbi:hypothetical protein H5410_022250 [Solanum commersonii]|uniref:Uncharacterized protein n=1 Tax=Solanum commersonii TaxID=4109 RepID=A0A9J5ZDP5_SOLCO|nr:hypothetical protein H5410_022250 [Solanum commersonii]